MRIALIDVELVEEARFLRVLLEKQIAGMCCDDIHNALYKKPSTRQYYLVLNNADCNELDFSRVCNVLAEYAAKLPNEYAKEAYYKEHYEVMIGEKALQKLKNL
jgi:adapter protein MecA 1/2